ncbi:uncharacterized protein LOC122833961 isoform X4 [Gambusia affinis]|uniref:uncharacterized protein LOC122833961 isoform X4 n=1 Tax=Gambusia affinis TaxID=33528 RepID=UPI001CDD1EA5|nr:uncharacterized protein LOC122833961 isoform X4 [Gambusia affinis]
MWFGRILRVLPGFHSQRFRNINLQTINQSELQLQYKQFHNYSFLWNHQSVGYNNNNNNRLFSFTSRCSCLAVCASSPGLHRRPAVCDDDDDDAFLQKKIKETSNRREKRNCPVVFLSGVNSPVETDQSPAARETTRIDHDDDDDDDDDGVREEDGRWRSADVEIYLAYINAISSSVAAAADQHQAPDDEDDGADEAEVNFSSRLLDSALRAGRGSISDVLCPDISHDQLLYSNIF